MAGFCSRKHCGEERDSMRSPALCSPPFFLPNSLTLPPSRGRARSPAAFQLPPALQVKLYPKTWLRARQIFQRTMDQLAGVQTHTPRWEWDLEPRGREGRTLGHGSSGPAGHFPTRCLTLSSQQSFLHQLSCFFTKEETEDGGSRGG